MVMALNGGALPPWFNRIPGKRPGGGSPNMPWPGVQSPTGGGTPMDVIVRNSPTDNAGSYSPGQHLPAGQGQIPPEILNRFLGAAGGPFSGGAGGPDNSQHLPFTGQFPTPQDWINAHPQVAQWVQQWLGSHPQAPPVPATWAELMAMLQNLKNQRGHYGGGGGSSGPPSTGGNKQRGRDIVNAGRR